MTGGKIMKETYSIKEILNKLEATEDGIWLIPNSDVAIVDERDLEEFELPESLETSKVICFWTTDEIRNYFSITNNKIVWFDNVLSEDATVFEGDIKEEIEIAVQINSRVKSKIVVPVNATQAEVQEIVLKDAKVIDLLEGKTPKKIIVILGRLVNIVV